MQLFVGVGAVLGLATLMCLLDVSGALVATVEKVIYRLTTMPFKIEKVAKETADAMFARKERAADNVEEYVEMLRDLGVTSVGETFQLPLETIQITDVDADGNETVEETVILADSISEDDAEGITVRMAKRRFNAAAKVLGFTLGWKEPKGWLIARATTTVVKVETPEADEIDETESDETEADEIDETESDETEAEAEAAAEAAAEAEAEAEAKRAAAVAAARQGNGGRRVVRRNG